MTNNNKLNDMLLETLANPNASTYDFLTNDITAENTQILNKEDYRRKQLIQDQFKLPDGKFDEKGFDVAYQVALHNFNQISNEETMKKMDQVEYDPFDLTRPLKSKTWNVDVKFSKDLNPFKQLYSRDSINSITESPLSLREIAQQGRVHDVESDTWEESANKFGLFKKLFGDTLVYAQWDEDGVHEDGVSGNLVKHKKGDWKVDDTGSLYLEKLGNREVYGKQVVNPSDILTTDGSVFNRFDFFDSDGREKSIGKTAMKTIVEIAPLLIPGVNTWYGGTRAAVGLATVMPTFYKSIESWLLGDNNSSFTDPVSKAEGWLAKFNQSSSSDKGAQGFWNFEQMSSMITDIFSQIYEQRAMASLSKYLMRPDKLLDKRLEEMQIKVLQKSLPLVEKHNIDIQSAIQRVISETPDIQAAFKRQSQLSKALSLGYMALTSTGDVYGEAIESGYDRRTAGFASLLTAAGQYGIMMNNRMGDWFLDKTTGYNVNVNRALMSKSVKPWLKEIDDVFKSPGSTAVKRSKLAELTRNIKKGINTTFSEPSVLGEAMFKNMVIEGVEEVTEQVVQDATKAMVDVMNYLGLTKGKGDFRTVERYATGEAFQEYLANFVGGFLGGGLFELERSKISPWIINRGKIPPETRKSIYELVANGQKDDLIREIRRQSNYLTDSTLSYIDENGDYRPGIEGESQADLVSSKAIEIIEMLDNTFNRDGTNLTDDEIINKAIRNNILLTQFEQYKPEGKYVGIEGLVIEDFRNNALEISKIRDQIIELEKQEGTEEQVKKLKETLNPLIKKSNDILSGDYGMTYFDQLAVILNPEIKEVFGSLDKDTYSRAKYNKDYLSLPNKGLGVTKESLDLEWQEFLDSGDILSKIDLITNAYKNLEASLNPAIAEYINNGYDVVRKVTQNQVLDFDQSIRQFNTSTTLDEKLKALQNFIAINKELGLEKLPYWDSFNTDMAETMFDLGLVRKLTPEGESMFTDEELNTVDESGLSKRDQIKTVFNNIVKMFPLESLRVDNIIDTTNSYILENNQNIQNQIDSTEDLNRKLELSNQLINFSFASYENSSDYNNLLNEFNINRNNILDGTEVKTLEEFNHYNTLRDNYSYEGSFITLDTLLNQNQKDSWADLSNEEKLNILNGLSESGILAEVIRSNPGIENFKEELENYVTNIAESSDYNLSFEENLVSLVDSHLNYVSSLLVQSDLQEKSAEIDTIYDEFLNEVENQKPEIFKMNNYAFDLLIQTLQSGNVDKELYNLAENMFTEALTSLTKTVFPGANYISLNDMIEIIESENFDSMRNVFQSELAANEFEMTNTVSELIEEDFQSDLLKRIILNNFDPNTQLGMVLEHLPSLQEQLRKRSKEISKLKPFIELNKSGLKTNPIYDLLRNFSLVLNSNPNSKVNKIFDILEREVLSFNSTPTVDSFISDNIREGDINQAVNLLDMMSLVVDSMSTTEYYGGDLTGFIAMRQQFAKLNGLQDDVLNLTTVSSDQAQVMNRDLQLIKNRLLFLKDLASYNSKKIAQEDELVRNQMNKVFLELWEKVSSYSELSKFIPKDFSDLLKSKESDEVKLAKAETSFYDFNKGNEENVYREILLILENVDSNDRSTLKKDTVLNNITEYDKALYIATNLVIRSEDHIKRSILALENSNKAPFFIQEFASKVAMASIQNPELFDLTFKVKNNPVNDNASFITFILGGAGTGKSTVSAGQVIDFFRKDNSKSNIWVSAPSQDQTNKLHDDIVDSIGAEDISLTKTNKSDLFKLFGEGIQKVHEEIIKELNDPLNKENKLVSNYKNGELSNPTFNIDQDWKALIDFDNLPNLLLIDEVTHFSKAELLLLDFISKASRQNDTSNFMKVIGLGDPTQQGYKMESGGEFVEYNLNTLNAVFTPSLEFTVRASNDQKRANNDMLNNLVKEAIKHYNSQPDDLEIKSINLKLKEYLDNLGSDIHLKYYKNNNTIKGDYIIDSYDNIATFSILSNAIKENPNVKLGILTQNGVMNPELRNALMSSGFTEEMLNSNTKTYTPENVQGSENDYFIFDMDLLSNEKLDFKYNKYRDVLRSVYTFTSRSKIGTIIVDKHSLLKRKLNIQNAAQSQYSLDYDPLTKSVINDLKEQRKAKLKNIVGENLDVKEKFSWKKGNYHTDTPSEDTNLKVKSVMMNGSPTFLDSDTETNKPTYDMEEFGVEGHTFYNNPNARVKFNENGLVESISLSENNLIPTDLNGNYDITDSEEAQKVLNEWGKLKTSLLRNKNINLTTSDYPNFFKHIFGNDVGNINIRFVKTASQFQEELNSPIKKYGFDSKELIDRTQEPFMNIMAELTLGNKVHYVTLASLAKKQTLFSEGIDKYFKSTQEITKDDLKAEVDKYLQEVLNQLSENPFIVLNEIKLEDINIITSTRTISKGKPKHKLLDLENNILGLNVSEIRMFPNNKSEFGKLLDKYTFGTKRDVNRIFGEKGSFSYLAGKPYIAISFSNDLDGAPGNKTSAKLIPISADSRNYDTLVKEITDLKEELHNEVKSYYSGVSDEDYTESKKSFRSSKELDAKIETMLDRSQILDILIQWGQTSSSTNETLLDLITKEIKITSGDGVTTVTKSLLDLIDNFKKSDDGEPSLQSQKFLKVIESVKRHIGDPNVKSLVISEIDDIVGWHWNFHNIFAYNHLIEREKDKDVAKVSIGFMIDESQLLNESDYNKFYDYTKELLDPIKNKQFYYSIPIVADGTNIKVNDFISGKFGYSTEFFADKFYINTTPESERILIPIKEYLSSNNSKTVQIVRDAVKSEKSNNIKPVVAETPNSFRSVFKNVPEIDEIMKEVDPVTLAHAKEVLDRIKDNPNWTEKQMAEQFFIQLGVETNQTGRFSVAKIRALFQLDSSFNQLIKQLITNINQCK